MEESQKLHCLLCNHDEFQEEEGKIDSKYGLTAHKVKLKMCKKCGFVMMFGLGRTGWDAD